MSNEVQLNKTLEQTYEELQRLESRFYDLDQITQASLEEMQGRLFSLIDRVEILENFKKEARYILDHLIEFKEDKI